ncbi:MAG: hypothetical protein KJ706_00395 [Candidatus Omnitrophica bacterium]|nr:hypothetical protein [Candidatus Omnitrophota bacterium]
MKMLKDLGRTFLIITEEERYIKVEDIKAVLFVANKEQRHLDGALKRSKERFRFAQVREIIEEDRITAIKRLWSFREEQFSAVVILDLDPVIVFFVYVLFHRYLLLYNGFGQWFLVRRKTLYEFLSGRRGADKGDLDWGIPKNRSKAARYITDFVLLCAVFVKNIFRALRLLVYLVWNIPLLFLKKALNDKSLPNNN